MSATIKDQGALARKVHRQQHTLASIVRTEVFGRRLKLSKESAETRSDLERDRKSIAPAGYHSRVKDIMKHLIYVVYRAGRKA